MTLDLQARPKARELILGVIVPMLLLIPFLQYGAGPQLDALQKVRGELTLVEQQSGAARALVNALEQELRSRKVEVVSPDPGSTDRVTRLFARSGRERSTLVALAVTALSDRRLLRQVEFRGVEVGKEEERKGYVMIPFVITTFGQYAALVRYLAAVETMDQPLIVSALDLQGEGKSGFLVAKMTIELYLPKR